MPRYVISAPSGAVVSQHRAPRAALLWARKHTLDLGKLTVSEYPGGKHTTGHVVMRISFDMETDWKGSPLDYWNNGEPVI